MVRVKPDFESFYARVLVQYALDLIADGEEPLFAPEARRLESRDRHVTRLAPGTEEFLARDPFTATANESVP